MCLTWNLKVRKTSLSPVVDLNSWLYVKHLCTFPRPFNNCSSCFKSPKKNNFYNLFIYFTLPYPLNLFYLKIGLEDCWHRMVCHRMIIIFRTVDGTFMPLILSVVNNASYCVSSSIGFSQESHTGYSWLTSLVSFDLSSTFGFLCYIINIDIDWFRKGFHH